MSPRDFFSVLIIKNHVYSAEQTDLVLPCSKTYRLAESFVDTAENQPPQVQPTHYLSPNRAFLMRSESLLTTLRASLISTLR